MKGCRIAYEVSLDLPAPRRRGRQAALMRSVVFTTKKAARAFQARRPDVTILRAVELCEATGKIQRTGKRAYRSR